MTEADKLAAQLEDTESARLHLLPYVAAELRRLSAENEALRADHARIFLFARDWAKLAGKRSDEIKRLSAQAADDTALLRQVLDALVSSDWYIDQLEMIVYSDGDTGTHEERAKVQAAITALRERLEGKA